MKETIVSVETLSQYGPLTGAYLAGAGSAWGFIMKWLLPRELKPLTIEIKHLRDEIAKMQPEIDELRELKDEAFREKLDGADSE